MALKCFKPQFSKLGHATKMALQAESSNFFHFERIKIDEKKYNDPIQIIPPHLGRILVLLMGKNSPCNNKGFSPVHYPN
jgi:hypothetical protein